MDKDGKNVFFNFFAAESKKLNRYVKNKVQSINEMDAEDIVSDVMLSMFNQKDIHIENLGAYVYRSLRNKIIDYQRKNLRTVSLYSFMDEKGEFFLTELMRESASDVSSEAERKEFFQRLAHAIDRLEPKQRAVFIATEIDGKTFKELAEQWGEPIGTLLSRKSRAVASLRDMLIDLKND